MSPSHAADSKPRVEASSKLPSQPANHNNLSGLLVERAQTLASVRREEWDSHFQASTGLRYDFLNVIEASGINDLKHFYLSFRDAASQQSIGRANLYKAEMDFATMDKKLPKEQREAIKQWYPKFMAFQMLECGLFAMIGDGAEFRDPEARCSVLERLVLEMEDIGRQEEIDFFFIRDVTPEDYPHFKQVLIPRGFRPAFGFANAVIDIRWSSLGDYLASRDSKTRYKLKTSLQFHEKYGIEYEIVRDYTGLAPVLARLWKKVNEKASEYSREQLTESFFARSGELLAGKSEIILFKHRGEPIAFMYNLIGDDDYIMLDWGVDYDFEHYQAANLYRAASLLSLDAAIRYGKKRMELGITNYTPKLLLGARLVPLAYFVRHREQPEFTNALARILTFNIEQPEFPPEYAPMAAAWEECIKRDQNERETHDIFQKVERQHKFSSLRMAGIYGLYPEFKAAQQSSILLEGGRRVVLVGTNSYLGLATHPDVVMAAKEAIDHYGTGCSGSPLLNGTLDIHKKLEAELASFAGKEAAVICSTGFQANLTAISALCSHGDVIIMDARNHRSLFDGAKLSGADVIIYRHNDMDHLRRVLERHASRCKIIVTDSVFSMEGTIARLDEICAIARQFDTRLYVDESHALGVLGARGRGACELLGVTNQVDLIMGTFSKSLAALGGFVAGDRQIIDYIKHNGSGHIFSASLPPSTVATVRAALQVIRRQPELRVATLQKAKYVAESLAKMGYRANYHGTPIVPVVIGNYTVALAAYKRFMDSGLYVNPVGPPAVPEEASGFRTSYMATHEWEDLDQAIEVFRAHRYWLASPRS